MGGTLLARLLRALVKGWCDVVTCWVCFSGVASAAVRGVCSPLFTRSDLNEIHAGCGLFLRGSNGVVLVFQITILAFVHKHELRHSGLVG